MINESFDEIFKRNALLGREMNRKKGEMILAIDRDGIKGETHTGFSREDSIKRLEYLSRASLEFFKGNQYIKSHEKYKELSKDLRDIREFLCEENKDQSYIEIIMILNALLDSDPLYFRKD